MVDRRSETSRGLSVNAIDALKTDESSWTARRHREDVASLASRSRTSLSQFCTTTM
jgi:hypothetical protein